MTAARRWERRLSVVVFVTLALQPLLFLPRALLVRSNVTVAEASALQLRLTLPKAVFGNLASALLLILLLAWSRASAQSLTVRRWCAALVLLAGLSVVAPLLASRSLHPSPELLRPTLTYGSMLGLFWVTLLCAATRSAALRGIVVGGTMLALLVIVEEWGVPMPASDSALVAAPAATFIHRNAAGLILAFTLPLAVVACGLRSRVERIAAPIAVAALSAGIAATGSRTCVLAGAVGLASLLRYRVRLPSQRPRPTTVAALVLVGLLAHAASPMASARFSLSDKVARFFHTIHRQPSTIAVSSEHADPGFSERLQLWDLALRSLSDHPFVGVGLGEFRSVAALRFPERPPSPHAHNLWLNIGAECGVPALAVAFLLALLLMRASWQLLAAPLPAAAATGAALLAFLAASLLESVLPTIGPNCVVAALAGSMLGWFEERRLAQPARSALPVGAIAERGA